MNKKRKEGIRAIQVLQMIGDKKAKDVVFTCDDCKWHGQCEYAFDPYNTNGDCLATK